MRSAFKTKPPRYPSNWDDFPAGEHIRHAVNTVCNDYAERIFGYHFAKLGSLSAEINLHSSPIRHHINHVPFNDLVSDKLNDDDGSGGFSNRNLASGTSLNEGTGEPKISRGNTVVGQSHCLPFAENSIDGFLLANELDFAQDPHEILREVDRVITQNGYVITPNLEEMGKLGMNPKEYHLHKENLELSEQLAKANERVKELTKEQDTHGDDGWTHTYSDYGVRKDCILIHDKPDIHGQVLILNRYDEYVLTDTVELKPIKQKIKPNAVWSLVSEQKDGLYTKLMRNMT